MEKSEYIELVCTRAMALQGVEAVINANLVEGMKRIRLECYPHDKRGDMVDLIIYAFNKRHGYEMFFPKSIRIPLKIASEKALHETVQACVAKLLPFCTTISTIQEDGVEAAVTSAMVPFMLKKDLEYEATLPQFERIDRMVARMDRDGSWTKSIMERREREEKEKAEAREKLLVHYERFDAMTDQEFEAFLRKESAHCSTDEWYDHLAKTRQTQNGGTEELEAAVSMILERGEALVPEWDKDGPSNREEWGEQYVARSYRGFTVIGTYTGMGSWDDLYTDGGERLVAV